MGHFGAMKPSEDEIHTENSKELERIWVLHDNGKLLGQAAGKIALSLTYYNFK